MRDSHGMNHGRGAGASTTPPGLLADLPVPLGLGLLRLATEGRPAEAEALSVIHFALDRGIRLLDTADVYGRGDNDLHYGERLARHALDAWRGPREEVRIITKAGLTRPKARWMPNGRPEHLRKAVEGSLAALEVERLFCLALHARDSRVPFEETLAALAELQREGKIEHLGLCNVSAAEVRQAKRHFAVAVVQNELSVINRKSAVEGMLALTAEESIPFLAHRPLGGYAKAARLAKNKVLAPLAERHRTTPHNIALAILLNAGGHVVPLIGATKEESVRASLAALQVALDVSDRTAAEIWFSFAPSPQAEAAIFPPARAAELAGLKPGGGPGKQPEVVLLMGMQGAGKSELVAEYLEAGYGRLNRDLLGGRLDDLIPRLTSLLASGNRRVVLDNTYPTRTSRAGVIAAAHAQGVPVRCRHLQTPPHEARYNMALRHLERYGRLLGPEELKSLGKTDPNLPPPAALARYESSFEPPQADEGFAAVDTLEFIRRNNGAHTEKGLLLDVDGTLRRTRSGEKYPRSADDVELLPARRDVLARWVTAGWRLLFVSNQSGVASGKLTADAAEAALERTADLLRLPVAGIAYCPHPAFPVGCFCRKPMPGLGALLVERHRLDREQLIVVGDMHSDAEFAAALGASYYEAATFFGLRGPSPE